MASSVYRFGDFCLDPASRELWHGEEEVSLPRKSFDCLLYLIEHRERAVERDELFQAVWGDVHLSDNVLHQAIFEARRALQDTGGEQRFIKTVRAFGYRWASAVEIVNASHTASGESPAPSVHAPPPAVRTESPAMSEEGPRTSPPTRPRFIHRPVWIGVTLALLAVGVTGGAAYLSRQGADVEPSPSPASPRERTDIALVLPVALEEGERHTWMRLGLMDLIAERLRLAGQPTVPSDNVVALARGMAGRLDPEELDRLANSTRASLILSPRVEAVGGRWRVSVRTLSGPRPRLTAFGEADDVLAAAGIAGDRIALLLGRDPAPELDAPPRLQALVRRVHAALLAQRLGVARSLIEDAEPYLRRHPEVRLLLGRIELSNRDLDAAESIFESLLQTEQVRRDPILHSRVLDRIAGVYGARGEYRVVRRYLEDAVHLLLQVDSPENLGRIYGVLTYLALSMGDLDVARAHAAQARRLLDSTGDVRGLGLLDANRGLLEGLRENWDDSLALFERAAKAEVTLRHVVTELLYRSNAAVARLNLLDPRAALADQRRLRELMSRVEDPGVLAYAKLVRARTLLANGRIRDGEREHVEVLRATEGREGMKEVWLGAMLLRAKLASERGDFDEAAGAATTVVEQTPRDRGLMAEELSRAWLLLVRAQLHRGRLEAAEVAVASLEALAERSQPAAPKTYAALARAELAAMRGRHELARAAFERALELADAPQAPKRVLEVARAYVAWLLSADGKPPDPQRAGVVAGHVAQYADRDYGAAVLLVRLYHATGPQSAWRTAVSRARALAGDREIASDLLRAPQDLRPSTRS